MNVLGKKGKDRLFKQKLMEEVEWISQHCDLLTLVALHEEFGFEADQLQALFRKVSKLHNEFKSKYITADDTQLSKNRCDTTGMKHYLKRIGFDYDKECEILCADSEVSEG